MKTSVLSEELKKALVTEMSILENKINRTGAFSHPIEFSQIEIKTMRKRIISIAMLLCLEGYISNMLLQSIVLKNDIHI